MGWKRNATPERGRCLRRRIYKRGSHGKRKNDLRGWLGL
ncbi:UNVERIFIED_CONTAM: hypothetical protein GTU68_005420 [Idotea baltica]|nr:hypothetical protein [Idotea baltica]